MKKCSKTMEWQIAIRSSPPILAWKHVCRPPCVWKLEKRDSPQKWTASSLCCTAQLRGPTQFFLSVESTVREAKEKQRVCFGHAPDNTYAKMRPTRHSGLPGHRHNLDPFQLGRLGSRSTKIRFPNLNCSLARSEQASQSEKAKKNASS